MKEDSIHDMHDYQLKTRNILEMSTVPIVDLGGYNLSSKSDISVQKYDATS